MAEGSDDKTHAATPRRLEKARERGEVAVAAEARHAVMFLAIIAAGGLLGVRLATALLRLAAGLWGGAGSIRLQPRGASALAGTIGGEFGRAVLPMLGLLFVAALLVAGVQGRPTLAWTRLKPKWGKLNPAAGLLRLIAARNLVEFAKTLAKCLIVLLVCSVTMRPHLAAVDQLVGSDPVTVGHTATLLVLAMLKSVLLLVLLLAGADWLWQHRSFLDRLRMSTEELRQEQKESDGDPRVKARQRQIGAARARRRMMAAVPTASVVVTNPTHFAVALRYDHGAMRAPIVVAKGTDLVALKIRALAEASGVPVVESPPLARALHAGAEIDRPIPIEHYAAVAEIISFVLSLARSRRGLSPGSRPG